MFAKNVPATYIVYDVFNVPCPNVKLPLPFKPNTALVLFASLSKKFIKWSE